MKIGRRWAWAGLAMLNVAGTCSPAATPPDMGVSACPAIDPAVAPIEHGGSITADETWAAGAHLVRTDVGVRAGATLTIAPCAVVKVRPAMGIDVYTGGTLVAEGTSTQPILFEPETAGGTWRQIQAEGGQARLAYASLDGAGDVAADPLGAALWLRGDTTMHVPQPLVRVQHVTITHAAKFGVRLEGNATFTDDSDALSVSGSAMNPVLAYPGSAGSIPAGTYTGNGTDEVLVPAGAIEWNMTLHDRGIPYHAGRFPSDSLRVMGAAIPVLTIEAGVTLRFVQGGDFEVEHFSGTSAATGVLIAIGTTTSPITFTSASTTPAAGDWIGITFGELPDARDRMENVVVAYAGAASGSENFSCANPAAPLVMAHANNAGIGIFGLPPSAFITNTTIQDSLGDGIERGWSGPEIDFVATNTFTHVAWCQQSFPRPTTGACPVPAPCPM